LMSLGEHPILPAEASGKSEHPASEASTIPRNTIFLISELL
jgi:hypothetical protein